MSKWAAKYVIGLTGNIGTGKSVVRRMLEHLGAYGIDADLLAHRAISKGAPGFQIVLQTFGRWVLGDDGEIDRSRLGNLVFSNPEALLQLENIVHPLVGQAVDYLIRRVSQPVIVIEAIKLLESGLKANCDSIWVAYATPEIQLKRLMEQRGMSIDIANQRISVQPSQEQKVAQADVIIRNDGTYENTWKQILEAWNKIVPSKPDTTKTIAVRRISPGSLEVRRGKPRHSAEIASFINHNHPDGRKVSAEDIMAEFGEKAYLLLRSGEKIVGLMGWQVENLVARAMDVLLDGGVSPAEALTALTKEMERASRDLQCEASLMCVPSQYREFQNIWESLGYFLCTPAELDVQAWQEAAREVFIPGNVLYFKQLRQDRVLHPI